MAVTAVTFACWDTLLVQESDEPRRAAAGLPPKVDARRSLFVDEVLAHHPDLPRPRVEAGYEHAREQFRHWWSVDHHTPCVARVLAEGLAFLGIAPTPGFDAVVRGIERMQCEVQPDRVQGVVECLEVLSARYKLGLVCDTVVTPGRCLREILADQGLDRFDAWVFSDEIGASKPSRAPFVRAIEALECEPDQVVHVGDREDEDVVGALEAGARTVLFTGGGDRPTASRADAVCRDLVDLPGLLRSLEDA